MVLTHACYAFFRSRYGSGQSEGEVRERRHSHTITSMTDSESPPQLPSPTHVTQPFLGKTPPTNVGEWSQTLLRCEAHDWDQSSSIMIWRSLSLSLSLYSGTNPEFRLRFPDHTLQQHPSEWHGLRAVRHVSSGQLSVSGRPTKEHDEIWILQRA